MTPRTNKEIGKFWGETNAVVGRWRRHGDPVDDDLAMAGVIVRRRGVDPKLKAKALKILEAARKQPESRAITTEDIARVSRSLRDEVDEITAWILKAERKMRENEHGNAANEIAFDRWDKIRRNYSDQKVKNLLAQAKLGLESGELVGKSDLAKLVRAFASRAWIALYKIQQGLCPKLVGLTTTREVMTRMESPLFMGAYIAPFEHARDMAAGIGLPGWVVDAIKEGYMELVELEPGDPGYVKPG